MASIILAKRLPSFHRVCATMATRTTWNVRVFSTSNPGPFQVNPNQESSSMADEAVGLPKTGVSEQLNESANYTTGHASQKTGEMAGRVSATAQDVAEKAKQTVQDAWGSAKDTAQNAKDTVLGKAEQSKESVKASADTVQRCMNTKN